VSDAGSPEPLVLLPHAAAATSLTDDLNVISNWAKKWGVQFNPQKTKNIVFSRLLFVHFPINQIPF
jgi:hypothetical protein